MIGKDPAANHSWAEIFYLFIFSLVLAFSFQGSRGLFSPDEGFYVCIGQAMTETNDYLIPRLEDEPWLDKPPLSLWGIAAGIDLFGKNEWGARAFDGLCFALTVMLVCLLGRSLYNKRVGLFSGIIYATMPIPFAAANVVTPDTPLTLWTTAAIFCFWKSVEPNARRIPLWKMLMCAAFGLGFLTKGPAALIPSAAMFFFLLLQKSARRYFLDIWMLVGFVLFCIIGLWWYAYLAHGIPGALEYFLDNQVVGRTISSKYKRSAGLKGALIYLPVILAGTLPWSLVWWKMLWNRRRDLIRSSNWRSVLSNPAHQYLSLLLIIPFIVLCLASSKHPFYALVIFPAIALITARICTAEFPSAIGGAHRKFSPKLIGILAVWVLLLMTIKLAAAYYPVRNDMRALHHSIQPYLPKHAYEIVIVGEHWEGIGFYEKGIIERVTTQMHPYPFFIPPERLDEEIRELAEPDASHLFLCAENRAEEVRKALTAGKIQFQKIDLPFRRTLFILDR